MIEWAATASDDLLDIAELLAPAANGLVFSLRRVLLQHARPLPDGHADTWPLSTIAEIT
jgi:hypothetical protein